MCTYMDICTYSSFFTPHPIPQPISEYISQTGKSFFNIIAVKWVT